MLVLLDRCVHLETIFSLFRGSIHFVVYFTESTKMLNYSRNELDHVRTLTTISTKLASTSSVQNAFVRHNQKESGNKIGQSDNLSWQESSTVMQKLSFNTQLPHQVKNDLEKLEERWRVKEVSCNFVSTSKPSRVIERLLARRKRAHEDALDSMKYELTMINEECENEFRACSTCVKIDIDGVCKEIKNVQTKLQDIDLLDLKEKDCENAWKEVENLIDRKKHLIDKFYECLKEIEKNRLQRTKPLMQKYYKVLHDISYLLPYEIQTYLENRMLNYNQATLGNHKVYANLHLQICLFSDTTKQKFKCWMEELKKNSCEAIRVKTLNDLKLRKEMLKDVETIFLNCQKGQSAMVELKSKDNAIKKIILRWKAIFPLSCKSITEWFAQLQDSVVSLDKCTRNIVYLYKTFLLKLFNEFYNQIQSFKVTNANKYDTFEQDAALVENMMQSMKNEHETIISNLEQLSNDILKRMQELLQEMDRFLQDSGSLWERHSSRLSGTQELILRSLENIIVKNDKVYEKQETILNVEIEKMRQECNKEKIEKQLIKIFNILDAMQEKYRSDFQEECTAIKRYSDLVKQEFPILETEVDTFFHSYPKDDVKNVMARYLGDFVNLMEGSDEQKIISALLKVCESQIFALTNWKLDVIEKVMPYQCQSTEELLNTARSWEEAKIYDRAKSLEGILTAHSRRYKDIQTEVYDVRIEEIEDHCGQLETHKIGISAALDDMTMKAEDFLGRQQKIIEDCERELADINLAAAEARNAFKIKRLIEKIKSTTENYECSVRNNIKECQDEFKNKLAWLRDVNTTFLREIKLHKDGGSFSVEEAKLFHKELTTCSQLIDRAESAILLKTDTRQRELSLEIGKRSKNAMDYINPMMQDLKFYEDILFTTKKYTNFMENKITCLFDANTKFATDAEHLVERYKKSYLEKYQSVEPFMQDWIRILDAINDTYKYLNSSFPVVRVPLDGKYNVKELKLSSGDSIANKRKKLSKTIDYRSLFFGSGVPPPRTHHFSSIVMNILWDTFNAIENKTMRHFSSLGKREITKPGMIGSNYHDFMEKTLLKLYYYYIQLENVWMQELKEFLSLADILKKNILMWIFNSFGEFGEIHARPIILKSEEIFRVLNTRIEHGSLRRRQMANSLKVTHGYPGHEDLLNEINRNVLNEENKTCDSIKTTLDKFKDELKELLESYKLTITEEAKQLDIILNKLESVNKTMQLEEFVKERLFGSFSTTSLKSTMEKMDRTDSINEPIKIYRNSRKFTGKKGETVFIPEHCLLSIPDRSQLEKSTSQQSFIVTRKSVKFSLECPVNVQFGIDSAVDNYIEKITEDYTLTIEKAEQIVNSYLNEGKEFIKKWNYDVEMVTKIYDVEYICNNEVILNV